MYVCLSVCHIHALCSNDRRYRQDLFPYDSPLCQPLPPQILPQSHLPPVDLSTGDIRWQIAAEWFELTQWSQCRAYRKPPSLFRIVLSLTPSNSLPSKWGPNSKMHPGPTSRRVLPPGEYDGLYLQDFFCTQHCEPSDVAFRQITLSVVHCFVGPLSTLHHHKRSTAESNSQQLGVAS